MSDDRQPSSRGRQPSAGGRRPTAPLIPAGGRFEGTLAFRGEAIVDGEVEGLVQGEGRLSVGPNGRIRGPVLVDELHIADRGEVEGDVKTRLRVSLDRGATLRGTLETGLLEVADGAVLEGPCRVGELHGSPSSEDASSS